MAKSKAPDAQPAALWRNRIVSHGTRAADAFTAHPANFRLHPAEQTRAITGALSSVGWVQDVIVNKRTGRLIDGHARVAEALKIGPKTPVPYTEVDLTEAEERIVLATLDRMTSMAEIDPSMLDSLLASIKTDDAALKQLMIDFGKEFAAKPAGETDAEVAESDADLEKLQRKWHTKPGQIWAIGGHRLLIGDSTVRPDVERLFGTHLPVLMVTDPPYGVQYDPAWRAKAGVNKNKKRMGKVTADDRADWTPAWKIFPGDVAYVWHGGIHVADVLQSLRAADLEPVAHIIWAKDRFALSRGDYHWKHEPCWYVVRKGAGHRWAGARDQSTVWDIPRKDEGDDGSGHGTQKPLECMARLIRNHGGPGDVVYDPFLGSGTTMVAAQNLQRVCYGVEIDPRYAAVVLERMALAFPKIESRLT